LSICTGHTVRMGGKSNGKPYEKRQEWRVNNLAIKRTKETWKALKGLEYTLKKCAFKMLTISYFLYSKPKTLLDMKLVCVQCKW